MGSTWGLIIFRLGRPSSVPSQQDSLAAQLAWLCFITAGYFGVTLPVISHLFILFSVIWRDRCSGRTGLHTRCRVLRTGSQILHTMLIVCTQRCGNLCLQQSRNIVYFWREVTICSVCVTRGCDSHGAAYMLQRTTCAWHLCLYYCSLPDPPSSLLTRWQPVTQKSWLTSLVPCKTCWGDSLPEWIVMLEWYGGIQCSGWLWCIALISDGVPSVL